MRTLLTRGLPVLPACLGIFGAAWPAALAARSEAPAESRTLTIGVVQTALEADLTANRDKMLRFVQQARARGCRVVVFPETALYSPPETPRAERDAAVEALCKAAAAHGVYLI